MACSTRCRIMAFSDAGSDAVSGAERGVVVVLVAMSLFVVGLRVGSQPVDADEQEHLHSAWLWGQGLRPYADSFEHHAPAYWLLLRPILAVNTGRDLFGAVFGARVLAWLITALSVLATVPLAREMLGSRRGAWFAMAAWAIFCSLSDRTVHARSDMLMVLLLLVGMWLVLRGTAALHAAPDVDRRLSALGGAVLALACCVSPKALFWCLPVGGAVLGAALVSPAHRTRRFFRAATAVLLGGLAPAAAMALWVTVVPGWSDFWFCMVDAQKHLVGCLIRDGVWDVVLWSVVSWAMPLSLAAVLGGVLLVGRTDGRRSALMLTCLIGSVALVLLANVYTHQYHFLLLWLFCVLQGFALARLSARFKVVARVLLAALMFAPACYASSRLRPMPAFGTGELRASLAPFQVVLDRMAPGDEVIALAHSHPVFIMDAVPRLWMWQLPFRGHGGDDLVARSIASHQPRFVVNCIGPLGLLAPAPALSLHYRRLNPWVWEHRRHLDEPGAAPSP